MTDARKKIRFKNPPVAELALSVQFDPIERLTSAHLGALWAKFKGRFPRAEDHQPLVNLVEVFGGRQEPRVSVKFMPAPPPPIVRAWFLSSDGCELVQVQQDRFVRNWRRVDGAGEYSSYAVVRDAFARDFTTFETAIREEQLADSLVIDQCEITYVDHFVAGKSWHHPDELQKIFSVWRWPDAPKGLRPEQATFSSAYVIEGAKGGDHIGRVHVGVQPARRVTDDKPIVVMTTIGRGRPASADLTGALTFMDRAHDLILDLFLTITNEAMQAEWGPINGA